MTARYSSGVISQKRRAIPGGAVAVGQLAAPLAAGVFRQRGTVLAALLAEWSEIAGPSLAAFTSPIKLNRPGPRQGAPRPPAQLVLKVDPARAIDVQYIAPQLIERINRSLGYEAVTSLRLIQAPPAHGPATRARAPVAAMPAMRARIESPATGSRLERALSRMADGVASHDAIARSKRTPMGRGLLALD